MVSDRGEARSAAPAVEPGRTALGLRLLVTAVVLVGLGVAVVSWAQGRAGEPGGMATSTSGFRHVNGPVTYETVPGSSGDHHPVWWDCGIYPDPVPDEHAVHSLEHGAVWLTYRPDVDPGTVEALEELASGPYLLLSPLPEQEAAVVATAWGTQIAQDELDLPALRRFLDEHRMSPDAPEPGAPCFGGTTEDLVDRG